MKFAGICIFYHLQHIETIHSHTHTHTHTHTLAGCLKASQSSLQTGKEDGDIIDYSPRNNDFYNCITTESVRNIIKTVSQSAKENCGSRSLYRQLFETKFKDISICILSPFVIYLIFLITSFVYLINFIIHILYID